MDARKSIRKDKNTRWTPEKVRERIRASVLVRRLMNHALGSVEMSATQVKAAEIVLRKVIPDLKAIEHSGTVAHRRVEELSDAELADYLSPGRGTGVVETPAGTEGSSGVH